MQTKGEKLQQNRGRNAKKMPKESCWQKAGGVKPRKKRKNATKTDVEMLKKAKRKLLAKSSWVRNADKERKIATKNRGRNAKKRPERKLLAKSRRGEMQGGKTGIA